VSEARREGAVIRARVQGAEKTHEPQITLAERVADVEVRCSCAEFRKTGRVCPHVLAAGVALLEGSRRPPGDGSPRRPAAATAAPSLGDRRLPTAEGTAAQRAAATVRIDGALSGLMLEIVAAEKQVVAEIESIGFRRVRQGVFSLQKENNVAHFLANTLPRWRRTWTVTLGPRLESALAEIDIAEPEFSLRAGSGKDWLSLDLKLSVGGKPVPLDQAEIQRWLQTGQSHARMANKRVLLVPIEAWGEMKEVLADCEVEQEPGKMRIARTFAPYLAGALTAQGFSEATGGEVHRLTTAATADVKAALDPELWAQLRPYQALGVEWLAGLAQKNFSGLLADDMGLGKTLQALAFAAWLRRGKVSHGGTESTEGEEQEGGRAMELPGQVRSQMEFGNEGKGKAERQEEDGDQTHSDESSVTSCSREMASREPGQQVVRATKAAPATLIVCPTSLVVNWMREAARFTPWLRTLDLTGSDRVKKLAARNEYDLLITSYAILRRDIEAYRADEFSLVILDEAQHIKNRGSQNAQSAKALRAKHRLILTGTPLENSVLDLWSLFDFLLPGYLGTAAEFKDRYETPLTRAPEPKLMARLRHRVKPFFLRRTKEEVLTELPPKLEFPTLCELSDEQKEVYRAVLAQGRRDVFEHSGKEGRKSGRDRLAVLTTLLRLKQVCCHLDLLPGGGEILTGLTRLTGLGEGGEAGEKGSHGGAEGTEGDEEENWKAGIQEGGRAMELPRQSRSQMEFGNEGKPSPRWREPSAKMERTFELIDEAMDGGHRVLLFSQFVRVLHLLRAEATRRELRFCYLDGQTVERQAEVDRFQNEADIPLFFSSA